MALMREGVQQIVRPDSSVGASCSGQCSGHISHHSSDRTLASASPVRHRRVTGLYCLLYFI